VSKHEGDGEARYDVADDEAGLVRELFQWVGVEGLSLAGVADRLYQQGVTTPKGKARWDKATIRGILLNPAYTGTAKYGKTRLFPRSPGRRPTSSMFCDILAKWMHIIFLDWCDR